MFTLLKLLDSLSKKGYGGNGIIRNKMEGAPLLNHKLQGKQERDSYVFMRDSSSGTLLIHWHDNSIITLASNCHCIQPATQEKRWSARKENDNC